MAVKFRMVDKTTKGSDLDTLTHLGKSGAQPSRTLETFPNHHPERDYTVTLRTDEFTCLCPATGQPDFAEIVIRYTPDQRIVESKSFKLYLWSFRDEGIFHEHLANVILDDFVETVAPKWCQVTANFKVRGGISITVTGEHRKS